MDAIAMIEQFTSGMDFEAFRSNPMAVAAVERKLQIVSEAAVRLRDEAERRCPDVPWRDIRGIGNQLRHAYERIDLHNHLEGRDRRCTAAQGFCGACSKAAVGKPGGSDAGVTTSKPTMTD
jgi:hypothetical protein